MGFDQAIAFDLDGQRILAQAAKLGAKPVADDAIDHKRSVDFAWSREDFAARQVAPFIGTNDAAGLDPAVIWAQVGGEIGPGWSLGAHLLRWPHRFDNLGTDAIYFEKVGAHAFQHDLMINVDHVGMPDF